MRKVSDEFWACEQVTGVSCLWAIRGPSHRFNMSANEVLARHICDLHNAAIVQERRGWDVKKDRNSADFYVPIHLGWENCEKVYGATPAAALLAANKWFEEQEAKA